MQESNQRSGERSRFRELMAASLAPFELFVERQYAAPWQKPRRDIRR